jgi:hypothetical protein
VSSCQIAQQVCKLIISGFLNGIIAYGVAFIKSRHLESWRILFLIEGSATLVIAVTAMLLLPEDIATCKWLTIEQREYCESCNGQREQS